MKAMNKAKIKVIVGVLLVFLLGVVTGVLGTGIMIRHGIRKFTQRSPDSSHTSLFMKKLSRELNLTETQKPDVEKIVEEAEVEIRDMIRNSRGEFEKIMQQRHAQLRELLTPEQQQQLDEMFTRMRDRWPPISPSHNPH